MTSAELRAVADDDCCARCTALARNARRYANRMELRDWAVRVRHAEPALEGAVATIVVHAPRKTLELAFSRSFDDLGPDAQRHALTHELVHPLLIDLYDTVEGAAREEFGGVAFRVFIAQVQREKEKAVDVLARIIAPSMPPIEW